MTRGCDDSRGGATSSVGEAGSRMICANINAFRQIGGTFPSKTKGNPLRLQWLRCWEYMTTAMFIITSNNSLM